MEISLRTPAAAPTPSKTIENGAAPSIPTTQTPEPEHTLNAATPTGLGLIGAVSEAHINALKDGKAPPDGIARTLKPYDTVILPYVDTDEKQVHRTA